MGTYRQGTMAPSGSTRTQTLTNLIEIRLHATQIHVRRPFCDLISILSSCSCLNCSFWSSVRVHQFVASLCFAAEEKRKEKKRGKKESQFCCECERINFIATKLQVVFCCFFRLFFSFSFLFFSFLFFFFPPSCKIHNRFCSCEVDLAVA